MAALFLLFLLMPVSLAAKNAKDAPPALHAQPWAFGEASDKNASLWRKGVSGKDITPRRKGAANTSGGINRALNLGSDKKAKSSLGLSMKDESSAWKVTPSREELRPDEEKVRNRRHVLRAFADVKATDDLKINVGPELILKDEQNDFEDAYSNEPDSALGLGMSFQLDF